MATACETIESEHSQLLDELEEQEQNAEQGDANHGDELRATQSCSIFSTNVVQASGAPNWRGDVSGTLSTLAAANYRIVGATGSPGLAFWSVDVGGIVRSNANAPTGSYFPIVSSTSTHAYLLAPTGAGRGQDYPLTVQVQDILRATLCSQTVILRIPMACDKPVQWWNNSAMMPSYDGANCYIDKVPAGTNAFMWDGIWSNMFYYAQR